MMTLYRLVTSHGLRKGVTIQHDRGARYTYSHFRDPAPQPLAAHLTTYDTGRHIAIDQDGNPCGLTEGPWWTIAQEAAG